jgi:hypothetical protein
VEQGKKYMKSTVTYHTVEEEHRQKNLKLLIAIGIMAWVGSTFSSSEGSLGFPLGPQHDTVLDSSGNGYETDIVNHWITKLNDDGNFITKWGSQVSHRGFIH